MLSSGTLNLKFMQRKPNPNIKPKLEETPSTKDAQVFRTQGTVTITQSSPTSTSQRRDPPTLRIVFEESLISFPWLSWRRPAPSSSDPAKDGILPAHIGRKSYGEFNKAIQKLDDGPAASSSSSSAPHKRPQPDGSSPQSSRTEKLKKLKNEQTSERGRMPRHGGERRHDEDDDDDDNADQKPIKKKNKKTKTTTTTVNTIKTQQEGRAGEEEASAAGFKKPFSATAIKTKRMQRLGDQPGSSKHTTTTKTSTKTSRQPHHHQQQPGQEQPQESIVISSSDDALPSPASDDNEAVHRQIDLMFTEVRNAHLP